MENNDIISRLMSDGAPAATPASQPEVLISTARVISIRYKIYVLVLVVILSFGVLDYVLPAFDSWMNLRSDLAQKQQQIDTFVVQKASYDKDVSLISSIETKEDQILSCLNTKSGCKEIDQQMRDNFSFVRSYLQLNNLADSKMEINEKILLANINEYLLRSNVSDTSSPKNGSLNSINLGDSKVVVSQLYSLPVRLNVTFATKDDLLSFIDNVDKNVLPTKTYRVLYKIDSINYDIMHYSTEQTVDIQMHAFYYKE